MKLEIKEEVDFSKVLGKSIKLAFNNKVGIVEWIRLSDEFKDQMIIFKFVGDQIEKFVRAKVGLECELV